MQHHSITLAIMAAFSMSAYAATEDINRSSEHSLDDIVVTATRIPTPDFNAPYASEVHTRQMIERSGAATLYDYLARSSSLQIMPSYGNRFSQLIDMRGYGLESGYQNVVVVLDGQRLNNIDQSVPLLSTIPLSSIDRIEISKGSGSVVFGDSAMAGVIQIHTRPQQGVSIAADAGNYGVLNGSVAAGLAREAVKLQAGVDYSQQDGFSDPDASGHKDEALSRSQRAKLSLRPVERLWLYLEGDAAHVAARYVNDIAATAFAANPATASGTYTRQSLDDKGWKASGDLDLSSAWRVQFSYAQGDKSTRFDNPDWGGYAYDYEREQADVTANYKSERFDGVLGVQAFNGMRIGSYDRTSKDNMATFAQGQWHLGDLTLSGGARREKVEYRYDSIFGAPLEDDRHLNAWDFGANWRVSDRTSLFGNLARSYQAPDVDRFFTLSGDFNGFIVPATVRTVTLGVNRRQAGHGAKLAVFRSNLNNEIYYYDSGDWSTSYNTNIDKSHKYGLELQDVWKASGLLTTTLNYAYTRAVIDHEDSAAGAYDGKELPGVPRHTLSLGLAWQVTPKATLNLSTTYRSSAYAMSDFANDNPQHQSPYRRTDLSYRVRSGQVEWFAAVENLFEQKNGIWTDYGTVYPVSFTRNWRVGLKADF